MSDTHLDTRSRNSGARRSRLTVLVIIAVAVALGVFARFYVTAGETQETLATIPCEGLQTTRLEIQGKPVEVTPEQTCDLMRSIAAMKPTADHFESPADDPWHYFGRMRILPKNDVWFLIFVARRSNGWKPEFSLQRRRGSGWAVVGQFDAEPVLRELGVSDSLDRARLASPESLAPVDQRQSFE